MGRNKLLLEIGGESLVRRAVRLAGEARPRSRHPRHRDDFREAVEREVRDLAVCPGLQSPIMRPASRPRRRAGVAAVSTGAIAGRPW